MRRQQSRDSCDPVAFARPRALAVRLHDCKISTFGRALHHLDQAQAACRAAARHGPMGGSFPRSQSCDIPRMAVFCRKSTTIYSNLKKNARPAVFLNRTH